MNRAEFLQRASLIGLGATLSPGFTFELGRKKRYRIGIVGAGITGLYLADALKKQGHAIKVLEASNRVGGRIFENKDFFSSPIDLGAQWIHGNRNKLYKILRKNKIPLYVDKKNESIKCFYKGDFLNDFPAEFYRFINEVETRTPLKNDTSVLNFAEEFSSDHDFIELIESMVTDAATKAANLSTNEISKMAKQLNPVDYQFEDMTMFDFINKTYVNGLNEEIVYNYQVNNIDYTSTSIKVSNNENEIYEFDKLILTVPITVLKSRSILFTPELPKEKEKALDFIGMDKGLKLFLKFEKQFFKNSIFNGRYAGYYIDPTKNDLSSQKLLTSLVMGIKAEKHYEDPQRAIENYLADLDTIFAGQASRYYIDKLVHDWGGEAFINGVYSYTMPGGEFSREIVRRPIANKIFFAGEAMNINQNFGTVHGAIETAIEVLKELV